MHKAGARAIRGVILAAVLLLGCRGVLAAAAAEPTHVWPQFRGPGGDGQAVAPGLPLEWRETQNVAWKTPIHDSGWSSPVVWGDQVWMTTALASGRELFAVCVDRASGKVLHDIKVFDIAAPEKINGSNTYASCTPLIEAGRLYVHFGTYGTACLDTADGKILWQRTDIHCDHKEGPGSSLAAVGNLLVFDMDGQDQQYVIALDKATGKTVWQTPRSIDYAPFRIDFRKAYSTPAVVDVAGRTQLVCTGAQGIMGYDALTGKEIWKVRFKGFSQAVRPICWHGLAFFCTDVTTPELWAVRLDGQGEVTRTHIAWKNAQRMPAMASPVLVDDLLYVVNDAGIVSAMDPATGQVLWHEKIRGTFAAAPLYAAGRLYFFGRNGVTTVLAPGREYRVLAVNELPATVLASPAVADNALFLRTKTDLYRIGAK